MSADDANGIMSEIEPLLAQKREYDDRCISRMMFTIRSVNKPLGQNCAKLLYNLLHRSRDLYDGSIHALRGSQVLSSYLTVRAHMETTGCIQYLRAQLRKYYDKSVDIATIEATVFRQFLGGKVFPDLTNEPNAPDAIQILKCVDSVEKAPELVQLGGAPRFREIYDFLSEYCHPNFLGHSVGVDTDDNGNVKYAANQSFAPEDLTNVSLGLGLSCLVVFSAYDHAMRMLSENEKMPDVQK